MTSQKNAMKAKSMTSGTGRPRGRPAKARPLASSPVQDESKPNQNLQKRGRGRPRKIKLPPEVDARASSNAGEEPDIKENGRAIKRARTEGRFAESENQPHKGDDAVKGKSVRSFEVRIIQRSQTQRNTVALGQHNEADASLVSVSQAGGDKGGNNKHSNEHDKSIHNTEQGNHLKSRIRVEILAMDTPANQEDKLKQSNAVIANGEDEAGMDAAVAATCVITDIGQKKYTGKLGINVSQNVPTV